GVRVGQPGEPGQPAIAGGVGIGGAGPRARHGDAARARRRPAGSARQRRRLPGVVARGLPRGRGGVRAPVRPRRRARRLVGRHGGRRGVRRPPAPGGLEARQAHQGAGPSPRLRAHLEAQGAPRRGGGGAVGPLRGVPESPPHAGGGMLLYYRTLLPELARLGHDVQVLVAAPFSPAFPAWEHDGVKVECVPAARVEQAADRFGHLGPMAHLRRHLGAAWAAREHAARFRFDLVEAADWGLLFAPWIAGGAGGPVAVPLHATAGQIDVCDAEPTAEGILVRLLEAALLAGAGDLVALGRGNAEEWERLTERRVRLVPPPLGAGPAPEGEAPT